MNNEHVFPIVTREIAEKRASLAPEAIEAFRSFSKTVFKEGELSEKTKQLIAIAVAHVTHVPIASVGIQLKH